MDLLRAAQRVVRTWGQRGFPASMRDLAMAIETDNESKLLANVAALTAELYGDERWRNFHRMISHSIGGFPGAWQLCIRAAQEFTNEEATHEPDSYEWIQAIELFAEAILTSPADQVTSPKTSSFYFRNLAKISIGNS